MKTERFFGWKVQEALESYFNRKLFQLPLNSYWNIKHLREDNKCGEEFSTITVQILYYSINISENFGTFS